MKNISIPLLLILFLTTVTACTQGSSVGEKTAETWEAGENLYYSARCIDGDTFVCAEYLYGVGLDGQRFYIFDLLTGKKELLLEFDPATSLINPPSISGDRIVWTEADISGMEHSSIDWSTLHRDIYVYDIATEKKTRITNDEYVQEGVVIDGNIIAWLDQRHNAGKVYPYPPPVDIYTFNLNTGKETRITAAPTAEDNGNNVAISGNLLVWSDSRYAEPIIQNRPGNAANYNNEIFLYDLESGEERRITNYSGNDHNPAIYGNLIVWLRQIDLRKAEIVAYDIETGQETVLSSSGYANYVPSVYENRVVWSDAGISEGNTASDVIMNGQPGAADIYLYDFSTGEEIMLAESLYESQIDGSTFHQVLMKPVIWGNYAVYHKSVYIGPTVYTKNLDWKQWDTE